MTSYKNYTTRKVTVATKQPTEEELKMAELEARINTLEKK